MSLSLSLTSPTFITTIIINTVLFAVFLALFYFLYVRYAEGRILELQAEQIANNFKESLVWLPEPANASIVNSLKNNTVSSGLSNSDQTKNDSLIALTRNVLIISVLVGIVVVFFMYQRYNLFENFSSQMTLGVLSILFIALTEFTFLNVVILNYISADPNYIKYTFLNAFTGVAPTMPLNIPTLSPTLLSTPLMYNGNGNTLSTPIPGQSAY